MAETELILRIFLALIFGSVLGLESETRVVEIKGKNRAFEDEFQRLGGIRTYSVISLIGGIAGLLFTNGENTLVYLIFLSVILLIVAAYVLNVEFKHAFGLTTEIAIIITFLLGFLTTSDLVDLSVIIVILVLLTFFLSHKRGISLLVNKIRHKELIDIVKFGLIALVILPILPNESYTFLQLLEYLDISRLNVSAEVQNFVLINPFNIWLIVVLISGLNLAGYMLSKFIGTKGSIISTGILGGLISSTSTIIALANQTKKRNDYELSITNAGAAIIANAISFFQIALLILVSNDLLFQRAIPALVGMLIVGFGVGSIVIISLAHAKTSSFEIEYEAFSIIPALKFVSLIVVLKILIQFAALSSVDEVFTLVSALSGVTGIDATTIAIADLNKSATITLETALGAFMLANVVNFIAKAFYSFAFGSKEFAYTVATGLLITLIGSLVVFI